MVTGASRGIGRACALALAGAGYDVAVTARTIVEGTSEEGLPGSLATTTAEIEALGARALAVPLDLLDRSSLVPAVETVLTEFGHIDVLVNNAIYVGQGNDERFLDVSIDDLDKRIYANITAQLTITQRALRAMVSRGGGTVINVTSMAGMISPPGPLGDGGWALVTRSRRAASTGQRASSPPNSAMPASARSTSSRASSPPNASHLSRICPGLPSAAILRSS